MKIDLRDIAVSNSDMDDAGPWGYLYFIRPLVSHSLPLLPPLTTPEVARGKKGGLGNNLFRYLRKRKRVTPIFLMEFVMVLYILSTKRKSLQNNSAIKIR